MKNTTFPFLLILLFISTQSFAQIFAPKWEQCYGGTGWDEGTGIIMADSTFWVVGSTESKDGDISNNHGNKDIWLLNVDYEGNLVNEKTFGGTKYEGGFSKILQLNDTVFFIASGTNSSDGDISNNPWPEFANLWILKINNHGNILWNRVCGGSSIDQIRDATVTGGGGIIALGFVYSDDGDITDHHGSWDLWLIKLNDSGQKQWTKSLGGKGYEDGGSVIQTSDGGYMVAGVTNGQSGGNFDTTCNYHGPGHSWIDAWVVKLDSLGNIEWQQCYGGTYNDGSLNAIELSDGYVILGTTQSNDGDVSGLHGPPGPNSEYGGDIWVFKIDFQGNLLWQKCLGGTYNDVARNIFPTSDGGFMIVGTTASKDGDVVGNHDLVEGWAGDIWFVKIDSTGNLLWQYCYGDIGQEYFYRGVVQKSDRDYVITLGTNSNDWRCHFGPVLRPDFRIAELYDSTVWVRETPAGKIGVNIYPNPARSVLNIELPNHTPAKTATVELLDISGRAVLKETFTGRRLQLNTSALNSGLYLVKVQTGKGIVTRKVVIKK